QAWWKTDRAYEQFKQEQREKERRTREAVPAMVGAAQSLADRENFPDAMRQVNLALDYDPEYAPAHLVKGQLLLAHLEFAPAQVALARYSKANPNDATTKDLLRLTQSARPEDGNTLLALADVLGKQQAWGPSIRLVREIARLGTARK